VNLSEIFVRRPVMTVLVMAGILIFGVVAFRLLPVSQLPNVDYPTIQVTAGLPGASPETMASAVATVRDLMRKNPLAVEVAVPGADKAIATGRIAFLDNAVDQTTGTIKVRAVFDNSDAALWPGQFYTVRVKLYDQENAIVVPSRALQTGPDGQFVYVVKADMTAEARKVTALRTEGDLTVLADGGLAKGERVVVRGALRLAPGVKVSIVDAAS